MTESPRYPSGHPAGPEGAGTGSPGLRSIPQRLAAGGWYFAVPVLTAGLLAAVPFWHAARRLGRPALVRLALTYTAVDAFLVVLLALTPDPNPDGSPGNPTISTIGGLTVIAVVVVGCLQLRGLRREVYGTPLPRTTAADPAVARALAARQRRVEARQLHASDSALARELGIGRPDLGRGYDDGGLVDLNTAPAALIAQVAGIDLAHAEAITAARTQRGGTYFNLGEVLVDVGLPPHVQEQLREHAVV
ncbi:helix-hairpin-helix domain-containing protein [Geodermatophilus sp. SYSU D01105]